MFTFNARLVAGAVVSAALLAGCGGNSDNNNGGPPPGPVAQTITDVVGYIQNLIASNGENTEPVDVNVLTLATDDTSEPAPLQ